MIFFLTLFAKQKFKKKNNSSEEVKCFQQAVINLERMFN